MKWIRWEVDAQDHPVVYELAEALSVHPMQALGHYTALCCRMGQHREDGVAGEVPDLLLERWAGWTGTPGAFATEVRTKLQDPDTGQLKGWWRQEKLFARAEKDRERHRRTSAESPQNGAGTSTVIPGANVIDVPYRSVVGKDRDLDRESKNKKEAPKKRDPSGLSANERILAGAWADAFGPGRATKAGKLLAPLVGRYKVEWIVKAVHNYARKAADEGKPQFYTPHRFMESAVVLILSAMPNEEMTLAEASAAGGESYKLRTDPARAALLTPRAKGTPDALA